MACSTTVGWLCGLFYCCNVGGCLVLMLQGWCLLLDGCVAYSTTVWWLCGLFYYCRVCVCLVLVL